MDLLSLDPKRRARRRLADVLAQSDALDFAEFSFPGMAKTLTGYGARAEFEPLHELRRRVRNGP